MKRLLLLALLFCIGSKTACAASSVVINELQTSVPQTVELYNNGTTTIDLSGWFIDDSGGATHYTIPDDTVLPPNKCISFESAFGFNTASADSVRLFNSSAAPTASNTQIMDSFSYDKITDATKNYQRIPDGSSIWVTSLPSVDKLNLTGVPCTPSPSATPTPSPTRTPTPSKTPTPQPTQTPISVYATPATYENVYITEVVPNPETGQNEWVEFYNGNDTSVILENWRIDDIFEAGASPYPFFLFIPAHSYAVVDLPSAMFNNDGDTVRLLDRNGLQKDNLAYQAVKERYSITRNTLTNGAACFAPPTRGAPNAPCLTTATITVDTTPTPYPITSLRTNPVPTSKPTTIFTRPNRTSTSLASPIHKSGIPISSETDPIFGSHASSAEILGTTQVHPIIRILFLISIVCALLTISIVLTRMNVL